MPSSPHGFLGLHSRPHPRHPRQGVACDTYPPSCAALVQPDPSAPSARFSALSSPAKPARARQVRAEQERLRHRNPTQLGERGGGMTRHRFSCEDIFIALRREVTLCRKRRGRLFRNKKGFGLGRTPLSGTDEAALDISPPNHDPPLNVSSRCTIKDFPHT